MPSVPFTDAGCLPAINRRLAIGAAILGALVGSMVSIAHVVGATGLITLNPDWAGMSILTAIWVLGNSVALALLVSGTAEGNRRVRVARLIEWLLLAVGLLAIVELAFGLSLLLPALEGPNAIVAPATAICFTLLSVAMLLRRREFPGGDPVADALALGVTAIALLGAIGYALANRRCG